MQVWLVNGRKHLTIFQRSTVRLETFVDDSWRHYAKHTITHLMEMMQNIANRNIYTLSWWVAVCVCV